MKTNKYLLIGVFALFVTIFLWAARWYTLNQNEQTQPAFQPNSPPLVRPYSPTQGDPGAPVTVVEFLDPECEACGASFPMIKKALGEFGRQTRR